jgi:hypothetical protein
LSARFCCLAIVRVFALAAWVSALAACSGGGFTGGAGFPPAADTELPADESQVKPFFFSYLRQLAGAGSLFEPEATGRLIGVTFAASVVDTVPQPPDCSVAGNLRNRQITTVGVVGENWYRTTASGVKGMKVPEAFINPAFTISDPPEINYEIRRFVGCTDRVWLRDSREATLSFINLSAFSCISPSDIKHFMPEAEELMASDGVSIYSFPGKVSDSAGSELQFIFRMAAPCAIAASVTQRQKSGLRFKRAVAKFDRCKIQPYHDYCASHPPFGWDGLEMDKMDQYAQGICGTVDSLYQKEPLTGKEPVPVPGAAAHRQRTSACDGF